MWGGGREHVCLSIRKFRHMRFSQQWRRWMLSLWVVTPAKFLKMEEIRSSETLLSTHKSKRRYNSSYLYSTGAVNLTSFSLCYPDFLPYMSLVFTPPDHKHRLTDLLSSVLSTGQLQWQCRSCIVIQDTTLIRRKYPHCPQSTFATILFNEHYSFKCKFH
jgi:hypothetical protein